MLDTLIDALLDTAKTIPFLIAAYLLIGLIETKASTKMQGRLSKLGPLGPIGGAVLGVIPQCGLSVAAANFFSRGIITYGTIIAVFLSTSDEFIPILISHPEAFGYLWKMIICKLVIAIVTGISVDLIAKGILKAKSNHHHSHSDNCSDNASHDVATANNEHCGCCSTGKYNFFVEALIRTASTTAFILAVNLVLGYAIFFIGEESIATVLLNGTIFQPFIAGLIGFIPNCASSVILSELFAQGALSFGSCLAGLCTGAGVGIAVLFKNNRKLKQNLLIMGILYVVAVGCGLIVDLFIH